MQNAPVAQMPGVYRRRVGDMVVTALNDGLLNGTFDLVRGIEPADAEKVMTAGFRPGNPIITVGAFVIHHGGKVILVDAGCGDSMGPDAGHLAQALNTAGVSPDAVDTILMTHLHPDHAGGLATKDGRAVFPNAELVVRDAEARFWLETANPPEAMKPYFEGARTAVAPYKQRMRIFATGEVLPGIVAEPLPGHTPGHTGYLLTSGGDALLIWGDIVHLPLLQSRHPEVTMVFDVDPAEAIAQRRRMFDKVSADKILVAGPHMDFPTFAHLERLDDGYAFVPVVWRPEL